MNKLKEKALEKMLLEMNQEHGPGEDLIHNELCNVDDDELFQGILDEKKSIKKSIDYCAQKARTVAINNLAPVDGITMMEWVREYFVKPDVEFVKQEYSTSTSSSNEKTIKKASKPKPKKQDVAMLEGEQLDLLNFAYE